MKVTLIHGDDILKARNRYRHIVDAIRVRGWEIVNINLSRPIAEQLRSNSLFSDEILFVLETAEKLTTADLSWLTKNASDYSANLLLLYKGKVLKTYINKLPKETKEEKFEIPQELFKMLDSTYPGNTRVVLNLVHKVVKNQPVELVFFMLARQFRDLYWVLVDEKSTGLPSWRIGKMKVQAKRFGEEKLGKMINKLADLDIKSKTSQLDLDKLQKFCLDQNKIDL